MIPLQEDVGFLVARTDRAMRSYLVHRLQPLGITFQQFQVLVGLSEGDGIPQELLAERVCLETSFLARLLQRLEKEGLIRRVIAEQDARVRLVLLTPKGQTLRDQVESVRVAALKQVLHDLSEEEVKELKRLLNRIFSTVRQRV